MENINNKVKEVDYDCIQLYEIDAEISLIKYGFIKDVSEADHAFFTVEVIGPNFFEYDYYVNQFFDNDQINIYEHDLGEMELFFDIN